jgi:hypothetical protein
VKNCYPGGNAVCCFGIKRLAASRQREIAHLWMHGQVHSGWAFRPLRCRTYSQLRKQIPSVVQEASTHSVTANPSRAVPGRIRLHARTDPLCLSSQSLVQRIGGSGSAAATVCKFCCEAHAHNMKGAISSSMECKRPMRTGSHLAVSFAAQICQTAGGGENAGWVNNRGRSLPGGNYGGGTPLSLCYHFVSDGYP